MNEIYLVFGAIQTAGAAVSIGHIVSAKRQRRAERFGERLALTSVELNALQQRMESSEAFEALVTEAVASACAADAEHRVGALASIVRRGLTGDDAVISEMRLAERAVHDLEPVDLRVLLYVASGPPATVWSQDDPPSSLAGGVDIGGIRLAVPGPVGSHEGLAARLVALGLIENCGLGAPFDYQPKWAVTEAGHQALGFLECYEG